MKIIYTLTLFVIFQVNQTFSQELSSKGKEVVLKAMGYSENEDYYNAIKYYEILLQDYTYELSKNQIDAVKGVLRDTYLSITMERAKNDNPSFKNYCLKGIQLGNDINIKYDYAALMFRFYLSGYYYHYDNEVKMNEWISKFYNIRNNLDTDDLSQAEITEIDSWTSSGISKMKRTVSNTSSSSYSFSFGDMFSGSSSSSESSNADNNYTAKENKSTKSKSLSSSKKEKNYIYITLNYSDGSPASNIEIRLHECGNYGLIGQDKAYTNSKGYAKIYNYDNYYACGLYAKGKKYKIKMANAEKYTIILK